MDVAKLKELLPASETKGIVEELKVQKAIDLVRESAKVTEVAAKEEKPAKKPAAKKTATKKSTSTTKKTTTKKTTKKEEAAE